MQYDLIKDFFAKIIRVSPFLRKVFYKILDVMFLRSWYVRDEIKKSIFEMQKVKLDVYDAGTGFGQYSYFIAKNYPNANILAIDLKDDYIKDCDQFFPKVGLRNVEFKVEDLTKIDHRDKFDLIICVDVMEHIEDDITVFKNFYNALKKDGVLIINTPSTFGGSDVHEQGEKSFIDEHARIGYSKNDFTNKLEPLGFKIENIKYTYGTYGDTAWRLIIKYPMILANISKIFILILPFYYLLFLPISLLFMLIDFHSDIKIGSGIIVKARKE